MRQLLLDRRLLVENQSVGGRAVIGLPDLAAIWGQGSLTFEEEATEVIECCMGQVDCTGLDLAHRLAPGTIVAYGVRHCMLFTRNRPPV